MKNALVIDDEQGIRDLMGFLLKPMGFQVSTAIDGVEGVTAAGAGSYDVIFLDIHMPRLNGIEALKLIKKTNPGQKVILFSSCSDPDFAYESEAEKYGAASLLYKPFDMDELSKAIEITIRGQAGE